MDGFTSVAEAIDRAYPDRKCAWCFHPRSSDACQFSAKHTPYFEYFAPPEPQIVRVRVEPTDEPREPELFCLELPQGVPGDRNARPGRYEIVAYVTSSEPDLSIPDNIILGDN